MYAQIYAIVQLFYFNESLCSVTQQEGKTTICATVPEAETQIVSLLQGKFLELLSRFRYYEL